MHVDMDVDVRAGEGAGFVALDESQCDQRTGILMHPLHVAPKPASEFAHADLAPRGLELSDELPASFGQLPEEGAGRLEVQGLTLVVRSGRFGRSGAKRGLPVATQGDGEFALGHLSPCVVGSTGKGTRQIVIWMMLPSSATSLKSVISVAFMLASLTTSRLKSTARGFVETFGCRAVSCSHRAGLPGRPPRSHRRALGRRRRRTFNAFGGYDRYLWGPRLWRRLRALPYPLRQALGAALRAPSPAPVLQALTDRAARMMLRDTLGYLPDDILCKVDRAAMSVSLETRAPFLDHRVVELAWRLPMSMKIRDGTGKWALRQLLYRHVPRDLIERPKAGFAIPVGQWLRGPLREWAEGLLSESRLQSEGYLEPGPVREAWRQHLSGRYDWTSRLLGVLMFQAWVGEVGSERRVPDDEAVGSAG